MAPSRDGGLGGTRRPAEDAATRPKKAKKPKLHELVGYTNEDNPFGDSDLGRKFVWKKREEQSGSGPGASSSSKGGPPPRRGQAETLEEIQKVRKRRQDREQELAERERQREEEARKKEAEQSEDWERKEAEFHQTQTKVRSTLRLAGDRARPVDLIAANMLAIEELEQAASKDVASCAYAKETLGERKRLELERRGPRQLIDAVVAVPDLEDLRRDAASFEALGGEWAELWAAVGVVADDALKKKRRKANQSDSKATTTGTSSSSSEAATKTETTAQQRGIHPAVEADVDAAFAGKSVAELDALLRDIDPFDDGDQYWVDVREKGRVARATARLEELHAAIVKRHQNLVAAQRRREDDNSAANGPARRDRSPEARRRRDTDDRGPGSPPPRAAAAAAAGKRRPRDDDDGRGQRGAPRGAALSDDSAAARRMLEREEARGLDDDEAYFSTEVKGAAAAEKPPAWLERYAPRKPRYLNRVKTGYDWNKYNQTHYSTEEPPPKIVQGYKFNIFYPDLVDPAKPPTYVLQPIPGEPDFLVIRFKAGPPYQDIAFKIVNQEWEHASKRGFRCVFERGVLHLHFNFKRWRYRR